MRGSGEIGQARGAGEGKLLCVLERQLVQMEFLLFGQEAEGQEVARERVGEGRLNLKSSPELAARGVGAGNISGLVLYAARFDFAGEAVGVGTVCPVVTPAAEADV
jgi:hypothetical protein